MSEGRLAARRRRELAPYGGGAGRVPGSAGRGYEAPHRASVAGLPAGIRYAADVDGGMAAVRG